jgi:hypothetical protein
MRMHRGKGGKRRGNMRRGGFQKSRRKEGERRGECGSGVGRGGYLS